MCGLGGGRYPGLGPGSATGWCAGCRAAEERDGFLCRAEVRDTANLSRAQSLRSAVTCSAGWPRANSPAAVRAPCGSGHRFAKGWPSRTPGAIASLPCTKISVHMAGTAKTLISIISRRSGRKGLNDDSPGLSAPESPGPRRGEDRDRTLLPGRQRGGAGACRTRHRLVTPASGGHARAGETTSASRTSAGENTARGGSCIATAVAGRIPGEDSFQSS